MEEETYEDEKLYDAVRKFIKTFYKDNPFVQYLKIDVTSIERDHVRLDADIVHMHTNVYGIAHGGVIMTMADTAMGAVCLAHSKRVVTLGCNVNFIKAVPQGMHVHAIGRVLHDGSRTMVCESEVRDADGTLYAKAQGTFFVLKKILTE